MTYGYKLQVVAARVQRVCVVDAVAAAVVVGC